MTVRKGNKSYSSYFVSGSEKYKAIPVNYNFGPDLGFGARHGWEAGVGFGYCFN